MDDGFTNETNILNALNNTYFKDLNNNLKEVIRYLDDTIDDNEIIHCFKKAGINKTDLVITFNNNEYNLSVKKGSGNSVHQEKVEDFIVYLENNFKINVDLSNSIRFFIWGDGTLDGTGEFHNRLSANQIKKQYPQCIMKLNSFFNDHKKVLIERFLFYGSKSEVNPHYIYYGTVNRGIIVSSKDILDWLINDEDLSNNSVKIGKLTFQAWNRNLNGGNKSENKRGVIQIKWGSIKDDLIKIRNNLSPNKVLGTKEGIQEEINFVKLMNKKENLKFWDILNKSPNTHYAIRVNSKKLNKVINKKVLPKADVYLVKGVLNEDILKSKKYYLDEEDVLTYNLIPVFNSGISIKRVGSKSYQIFKMVPDTFKFLFKYYELGAGASLYSRKEEDLFKNRDVIKGWKTNNQSFYNYFESNFNIKSNPVTEDISSAKEIKKVSIQLIENMIKDNEDIRKAIFQGIPFFDEPYTVHYLYENGELKNDCYVPFNITTGSGRSKGIYTLVIKPTK